MRESPELRELTSRLFEAVVRGDEAALLAATAREPGALFIGTDPDEWGHGYEAIARALSTPQQEYEASDGTVADAEVVAHEAGAVGWAACRGKVTFSGQAPIPLRVTLVALRRKEGWRLVQWHLSIGVPNAEAFQETVVIQAG